MKDDAPSESTDPVVDRFDHVSIAAWDIRDALPLIELMGGEFYQGGDEAAFRWAQWHLPGSGKIEVIQPLDRSDADNFLVRFLSDRGPGIHHLTFRVHDLTGAVAHARTMGFEVTGVSPEGAWKEAFIHPRSTVGTLIQLAEWDDSRPDPGASTRLDDLIGPATDA
jgi:methylmalonyl-CoA/ethylmalonyl-CoA epimerase